MRIEEKENYIEIQEETRIPQGDHDLVLEPGDMLKIVSASQRKKTENVELYDIMNDDPILEPSYVDEPEVIEEPVHVNEPAVVDQSVANSEPAYIDVPNELVNSIPTEFMNNAPSEIVDPDIYADFDDTVDPEELGEYEDVVNVPDNEVFLVTDPIDFYNEGEKVILERGTRIRVLPKKAEALVTRNNWEFIHNNTGFSGLPTLETDTGQVLVNISYDKREGVPFQVAQGDLVDRDFSELYWDFSTIDQVRDFVAKQWGLKVEDSELALLVNA